MPDTDQTSEPEFTAEEYENSFPMDGGRRFRNAAGWQLVNEVLAGMRYGEIRLRRRGAKVEERERSSVEVLLANVSAACLNVVDPDRFAAVSFNKNDYAGKPLDAKVLRQCRLYLEGQGLIIVGKGFLKLEAHRMGYFGRQTRIRASELLRERIEELGIGRKAFTVPVSELIRTKGFAANAPTCPPQVEESRHLLAKVNQRLAMTEIEISEEGLAILAARLAARLGIEDEGEDSDDRRRKLRYAGDRTANSLYRAFKGDWSSGGRIYGGWWMSEARDLRPYITINGSETVELDYGSLHPRLLYHRAGLAMDFDPYLVPPYMDRSHRELGKKTFNRLLNTVRADPDKKFKIRAAKGDKALLVGTTFAKYQMALRFHLEPIQKWFGTGAGVKLQHLDSEIAIAIMSTLEDQGVTVLPVHDSFIVAVENESLLHSVMVNEFAKLYTFFPDITTKRRPSINPLGPPIIHN